MAVVLITRPHLQINNLEGTVVELVRRRIGDEWYSRSREVEIVKAESESADALIGVEVEAEVVCTSLPAQLDI